MAGHNKWSKVKHIKERLDAKKGKVFSKIAREITIAAKAGGGDADANPRLRTAISSARAVNMPADNVDRAIKKGTGELAWEQIEEMVYEGFGPGGIAFMIETATDNKNRSANDLRTTFGKNGGNMGGAGSVAFLFDRKGEIKLPLAAASEDTIMEAAIDAGADDVTSDDDEHTVLTPPDKLYSVVHGLKSHNLQPTSSKLVFVPQTTIILTDDTAAAQALRLFSLLDELDDTQNVYTNFDIPDDILAQLES